MAQSVVPTREGQGIARGAAGKFTGDGTAVTVTLGFKPKHVRLINLTDIVVWEKMSDMIDSTALKTVAAGTITVDTTTAVVLTDGGFTVAAAAGIAAKAFVYFAE